MSRILAVFAALALVITCADDMHDNGVSADAGRWGDGIESRNRRNDVGPRWFRWFRRPYG